MNGLFIFGRSLLVTLGLITVIGVGGIIYGVFWCEFVCTADPVTIEPSALIYYSPTKKQLYLSSTITDPTIQKSASDTSPVFITLDTQDGWSDITLREDVPTDLIPATPEEIETYCHNCGNTNQSWAGSYSTQVKWDSIYITFGYGGNRSGRDYTFVYQIDDTRTPHYSKSVYEDWWEN
jgi:hypothetical protein